MRKLLLTLAVVLGIAACSKDIIYIDTRDCPPGQICEFDLDDVNSLNPVTVTFSLNRQEFVIGEGPSTGKGKRTSTSKVGDSNMPHYWPNEDMLVTFTHVDAAVGTVTTTINPSVLTLPGNETNELSFVPGEWTYTATSSNTSLDFSATLPFTLEGSFTAYGQTMSLEFNADTNFSFISIENDDLCGDGVLLSKDENFGTTFNAATDSVIITEISTVDHVEVAYAYAKVSSDTTYVALPFDNDLDNSLDACTGGEPLTVGVGQVEIDTEFTHYHYGVTVNRGDAITTGSWFDIDLEEFTFKQGNFTIGSGIIDFEVAFSADNTEWKFADGTDMPTVWSVERTSTSYQWYHADYDGYYIRPDNNTPIEEVYVYNGSNIEATFVVDGGKEGDAVRDAIEFINSPSLSLTVTDDNDSSVSVWLTSSRFGLTAEQVTLVQSGVYNSLTFNGVDYGISHTTNNSSGAQYHWDNASAAPDSFVVGDEVTLNR